MTTRILAFGLVLVLIALAGPSAPGQAAQRKQANPPAATPAPPAQIRILTLRDADAAEVVKTLKALFADDDKTLRIGLHESSNSIVLLAPPDDLERVEAIIMRLDQATAEKKTAKPDTRKSNEPARKPTDEDRARLAQAEAELEQARERNAWAARMVKLGYISPAQAAAEQSRLAVLQAALAQERERPNLGGRAAVQQPVWEYKVIDLGVNDRVEPVLNKAGAEGWELVAAVHTAPTGTSSGTKLFLKRGKR